MRHVRINFQNMGGTAVTRRLQALIICCLVACPITYGAGFALQGELPAGALSPVPGMRSSLVTCTFKGGRRFSGLLLGIDEGSIYLGVGGKMEPCSLKDLILVQMGTEKARGGAGILTGMGLSWYAYSLFTRTGGGYGKFGYVNPETGFSLLDILVLAAGGALGGGLLTPDGLASRTYDFSGPPSLRARNWERLRAAVLGLRERGDLSLRLSGGVVDFGVRDLYAADLQVNQFSQYPREPTKVQLFRRVQVCLALSSALDVGIAWVNVGEPPLEVYGSNGVGIDWGHFTEDFSGQGYFGVCVWHPLVKVLPHFLDFGLGAGMGAVRASFSYDADYNQPAVNQYSREIFVREAFYPAGMAMASFDVRLSRLFAVGITADAVLAGGPEAAAVAPLGVGAHHLRFGNSSLGLNAAFRF